MFVSEDGYVIVPSALWAKTRIVKFYRDEKLSGNELNKTFHKSWEKVRNSTRFELLIEQIRHYMSTYGTDMKGEIYIPDEAIEVPDLKLCFKVINAYTVEEMTEKCLDLLRSGIALTEETINDVLSILVDELKYGFTGKEGVRNKEAIIKIADLYGVVPEDTMEFFRYVIYRATGESLLIKSPEMIQKVKETNFNPAAQFNRFGVERLAEIFNRFKPLFLAFKKQCSTTINRISKLSKTNHKPLVVNPLNLVTHRKLEEADTHWLNNATPFALFKALTACHQRMKNQTDFVYRIRNGKSWVASNPHVKDTVTVAHNFVLLNEYIATRFNLSDTKIFLPEGVEYALPTSEKMFVGNIPTGTRFFGDRLAVGMYWKNDGGARDIDLSALNISGEKIGWNSHYSQGNLTYSGDITNAPNGAVEYMHSDQELTDAYLIMTNVYSGNHDCSYKIIIGRGSSISQKYMMNPNNLFVETSCKSVQKQTVLGMLLPANVDEKQSFVLLNFGAGQARVSGRNSTTAISALYQQWSQPFSFNELLVELGADIVSKEDADIDLSLDNLDKDSFTKLFI